ncbi:ribosome biogenesis GTP-binding protein YsxC [Cladophialophora carrionii CBS 160.54]|uniref:Ribosome biogenesis GTP-binding protein YsxC n=1 Tax=Cladophialophora carrionii CBS 160.54 TaxID=1279043 RepID=V9D2V0_9EURO|nr:ribosome biogenesis GTP-binding protein YsxC [Cladophialophora carrionii CBS 160.54]ETI20317.1 ribosome biogenesis GTP-binding protein YsxC [Cladophialophora carrionii CBS 160.54]
MQTSTCFNCRFVSRYLFQQRLAELQNGRRRLSSLSQVDIGPSWYWDTQPPTKENLAAAAHFFKNHKPSRLWTGDLWKTSELWRRSKKSSAQKILVPEVVFLGRSNVGKSTLINAVTSIDLNRVSTTPGMTEVMAAWGLAAKEADGGAIKGWDGDVTPKVTLVDMPGYGFGSRSEWGTQIVSYLNARRNVRRAFLLVDSVHGIMAADRHMLEIFQKLGIPFQLIATKCDRLRSSGGSESEIREVLERLKDQANRDKSALMLGEIIAVGSLQEAAGTKPKDDGFGIRNLQWAILKAANLEWYAMDKAAVHKVIDKSATQRPQEKIQAEISHLLQKRGDDTQAEKSADTGASASSESPPNLGLREFMREILGTGSEAGSSAASPSQPNRNPPRVFDPLTSDAPGTARWKAPTNMQDQLDSAYQELQKHMHAASPQDDRDPTLSHQTTRPSTNRVTQRPAPARRNDQGKAAPAPTTTTPQSSRKPASGQQQQRQRQPPLTGKGVSLGLDAFEAMFAEPPKQTKAKSKQSQSSARQRTKAGASSGQPAARQGKAQAQAQRPKEPAMVGKGVSRGIDAFESMFAEPAQGQKARRKR